MLIKDLLFGSKVRQALKDSEFEARFVDPGPGWHEALTGEVSVLILDLGDPACEPLRAIEEARSRGIPVLAYGPHAQEGPLEAARAAGAERVVPRSAFSARTLELVREAALLGSRR